MSSKATKGLIPSPPVTSAVFLIVILVKRRRLGGISETPLLPYYVLYVKKYDKTIAMW
jgi:hypothetical protein